MKLIDKDALVAKIEKLKEEIESRDYAAYTESYIIGVKHTLETVSDILDTLEVKEVDLQEEPVSDDLEKEIDYWYNTKASKEFEYVLYSDIENCAKYFFELGISVSNKVKKGE